MEEYLNANRSEIDELCDSADRYICEICRAGIDEECDAVKHSKAEKKELVVCENEPKDMSKWMKNI